MHYSPHDQSTDEWLIKQVVHGDESALCTLYERYRQRVYMVAYEVTSDCMTAEEVTQDVFQGVWQSAHTFQAGSPFVNWLMGIAYHRAIDATRARRYRARRREERLDTLDAMGVMDEVSVLDQLLLTMVLRDALDVLPLPQRQAMSLAYGVGLTHPQIATNLREPLGTIKTRIHSGLMRLRAAFQGEEAGLV